MWVPAPGPRGIVLRPDAMAEFGNNEGSLIEQECQYYNSHKEKIKTNFKVFFNHQKRENAFLCWDGTVSCYQE